MTIIYDYFELEERATHHLRLWKAWHIILFIFIAIFGVMNFTFFHATMAMVDDKCILNHRKLEFVMIPVPNTQDNLYNDEKILFLKEGDRMEAYTIDDEAHTITESYNEKTTEINNAQKMLSEEDAITSSDTNIKTTSESMDSLNNATDRNIDFASDINSENFEIVVEMTNKTVIVGNKTSRLVLNTERTLFGSSDCEFAGFMPLLSTVFAIIWIIFFILCPAGGRSTRNWQHPWHILTPALTSCVVLVCVTGYSFSITNNGLHQFCSGFFNLTGSLKCSSVNPFLASGWHNSSSWGFGARVSAVRAASAGVWAGWTCAASLLVARCLTVRDFMVRRKTVRVKNDPFRKVLPSLTLEQLTSALDERPDSDPKATGSQLVTACVESYSLTPPPKIVVTPSKDVEMTSRVSLRSNRDKSNMNDTTI